MPRILPRLIERINLKTNHEYWSPSSSQKPIKGAKSLFKPVPPRPSFKYTSNDRSLLLDPENPVAKSKDYARHKSLPPSICRPSTKSQHANSRQMTEAEFEWWANPYLRMMSSPIRKCAVTTRLLPSDLLVRLVGARVTNSLPQRFPSSSHAPTLFVPDGILHPKYTGRRRTGGGVYILCCRRIIQHARLKGLHNPGTPGATVSARLEDQIAHLLRLRILQELEMLADRLEYAVWSGKNRRIPNTVLRRLTKDEWNSLKSSNTVTISNAVAILVVPPVNKDVVTKQKPRPSMSPFPPVDENPPKPSRPVSTLLSANVETWDQRLQHSVPLLKIPLYNGASAFPSRSQRAALHAILQRIIRAERSNRHFNARHSSSSHRHASNELPTKYELSHAFVLCSDAQTAKRGDPASIARALWRLHMYESEGWTNAGPIVRND